MRRGLGPALVVLALILSACGGRTINGSDTVDLDQPQPGDLTPAPLATEKDIVFRNAWALADIALVARDQSATAGLTTDEPVTAVYFTMWNNTTNADKLVGAQADVASQAGLFEIENNDGIKSRRRLQELYVAPNAFITLFPDSYQILLSGLKQPLKPGDKINLTLQFEKAGSKTVNNIEVRDPASPGRYTGKS